MLSIITPVLPTQSEHLSETAKSISAARDLIDLEWIVVVDGPGTVLKVPGAWVISLPEQSGISEARNVALVKARGDLVFPLDADDILIPDGLEKVVKLTVEVFDSRPDTGFIVYRRILHDGQRTSHWFDQEKSWGPGDLQKEWRSPFPFHPNSVIFRRSAALALGGYPALKTHEDLGFLLLLNSDWAGQSAPITALLYRAWEGQTSASENFIANKKIAFRFIWSAVNSQRLARGMEPIPEVTPTTPKIAPGLTGLSSG